MDSNDKIQLFEDEKIRTAWNEKTEEWCAIPEKIDTKYFQKTE